MKEFIELTDTLARFIGEMEIQRKKTGEYLRQLNSFANLTKDEEVFEKKIILPVQPIQLENMKIAGVDGGLVKKSFHGIDLMLLRAVGVIFSYDGNKLSEVKYHPDAIPTPEPKTIIDPFSDLEFEINSNIERQITEVTTAKETVEKHEPDVLFLNGSVIPHYTFVPDKSSLLYANYSRMIEAYTKLFNVVKERKTILAGVIEDSRGIRFCEVMNHILLSHINPNIPPEMRLILNRSKDSNLLTYALQKGERSFVFPYSSDAAKHPILKEFIGYLIFSFYVKTAEFDRPIRVDFLADKGTVNIANRISSILLALCGHSGYGMPSVLIEADQRAKLSEKDLEMFYFDIINKSGNLPGLLEQRRYLRPF